MPLQSSHNVWRPAIGLLATLSVVLILAACGGGRDDSSPDGRAQPLAVGNTATKVSWAPTAITMSANPGGKQDIPLTVRATVALSNVTVSVPSGLKSVISITPTALGSLAADQTATVTVTVAPGATEALRTLSGALTVRAGFAGVGNSLPITLTLVAPESIQGIAVPPEPPKELNDLTLAGFDMNGNGVRDDVERLIASASRATEEFSNVANIAKSYHSMLLTPELTQARFDELDRVVMCADIVASDYLNAVHIRPKEFDTAARREAYKLRTRALTGRFNFPQTECR